MCSESERGTEKEAERETKEGKVGEENHKGALMHMFDRDKWRPIYWLLLMRSFATGRCMWLWCGVHWWEMTAEGGCGGRHFIKYNCCLVYTWSPRASASLQTPFLFKLPSCSSASTPPLPLTTSYLFPLLTFLAPIISRMHYFLLNKANRAMCRCVWTQAWLIRQMHNDFLSAIGPLCSFQFHIQ